MKIIIDGNHLTQAQFCFLGMITEDCNCHIAIRRRNRSTAVTDLFDTLRREMREARAIEGDKISMLNVCSTTL